MKEFFENITNRILLISSLILNIGLFLFFYFFIKQNNIPIVLHYNVNWGVDYLGEVKSLFILPIIGIIIFLLNGFLAIKLWKNNHILSYFLTITIFLIHFFLVINGVALYLINR